MVTLPSCPFPNHLWYHKAMQHGAVVDVHENYIKQSLRNRIYIPAVNGLTHLTLPVEGLDGVKTPLKEVKLAPGKWRKLHWTSIRSAYGKAPFFEYFEAEIALFWERQDSFLLDFNRASLEVIRELLGIDLNIGESAEYVEKNASDFRHLFKGNKHVMQQPEYLQVFSDRHPFEPNTSILDLLFNLGPETESYLMNIKPF